MKRIWERSIEYRIAVIALAGNAGHRIKLQPNQSAPISSLISAGTKFRATPSRRIVLRNQNALRSAEDLYEKAAADHAVWQKQLATLKRDFKPELLDPQAQLSYKLFEREAEREAEEFKFRFDVYPVSQMRGVHAPIPTFMINIHKIDDVKDAEAYIARLRGFPKLFDQLLVNLKMREEKGVVAPHFVFPLVLDACHKIIKGSPSIPGLTTVRCWKISRRK